MASYTNSRADGRALDIAMADVLRRMLGRVSWLKGWEARASGETGPAWDIIARGPLPDGGKGLLCVEVKRHFTPSQFLGLVDRPYPQGPYRIASRVLAMPRVSPRLASLCAEHGWSWFDLAGNCRLELAGVFLIERSGNQPMRSERLPGANLGTPEAARVVRALLAPENSGRRWTQRDIVDHFADLPVLMPAPSLALVNKVVQHLRAEAFLDQTHGGGFTVRDHEGLLRAWKAAYRFGRHARHPYFTLLRGKVLLERLRRFAPDRVAFAAFSAADIQAPAVRQPLTWLFVDPFAESELREALEAKPVDSGENIIVLVAADPAVFYMTEAGADRPACTNAVQTYVDSAHVGGRGDEAAEAILQQRLKPAWAAAR
ncbi:MAG: hypothetical protein FJ189_05935 [Gammaproteobacteria bacterium]|nr:hypothetical protein [Gammaproteobacteria bacterium]